MPNDVLRRAMNAAKMKPVDLAVLAEVDPKTVEAWLRDESRMPHAGTRMAVAEKLGVPEVTLWPRTKTTGEIIGVYAIRPAMPTEIWRRIIGDATSEIVLCAYSVQFLWIMLPDLSDVLRTKTEAGCRVRVIIADPSDPIVAADDASSGTAPWLQARIDQSRQLLQPISDVVEVRQSVFGYGRSVFRGDNNAILTIWRHGISGSDYPVLHLRRHDDGGIFDQMAVKHIEALWESAVPVDFTANQ